MALTKEDLTAINGLLEPLRTDMQTLTGKVTALRDHVENETDRKIADLQDHVENETDRKLTALSLHVENETDKGIQLVAENHCALNDKLDQILFDYKTNTSYDVEISSLKARMSRLEARMKEITA